MKIQITIENLGDGVRLTLGSKQGEIAENQFANLAWACGHGNIESNQSFITPSKKLIRAIKSYRSATSYLSKTKDRGHPFDFKAISQRNYTNSSIVETSSIGEYQDTRGTWEGYKPRIAKYFDKTEL